MNATNYFKVRGPAGERVFPFATWDRRDIRGAYNRATSIPGRVTVFYRVPLSGPWDSFAVISPESAPLPVAKKLPSLQRARAMSPGATISESWCE